MFKNINCEATKELNTLSMSRRVCYVSQMLKLLGNDWVVDTTSERSKRLLKCEVITLTNGVNVEEYVYLELVLYRLPPMLFSNNCRFLTPFRRSVLASSSRDPLLLLGRMVERYYQTIKKQPNFKFKSYVKE